MTTPIATALGRLGLTPNALTLIGFVGTCIAAFAAANQWWLAAGVLVLAFGIFDLFDGSLARATGRATKLGAFLDSTFDRAGEAIAFIGIAAGCLAARFDMGAILASAAMAAAFMVSYTRAKGESLGFAPGKGLINVGLAPREVRLVILALGLVLTGLASPFLLEERCMPDPFNPEVINCLLEYRSPTYASGAEILGITLSAIAILATITTIQRVLHVRAQSEEG